VQRGRLVPRRHNANALASRLSGLEPGRDGFTPYRWACEPRRTEHNGCALPPLALPADQARMLRDPWAGAARTRWRSSSDRSRGIAIFLCESLINHRTRRVEVAHVAVSAMPTTTAVGRGPVLFA